MVVSKRKTKTTKKKTVTKSRTKSRTKTKTKTTKKKPVVKRTTKKKTRTKTTKKKISTKSKKKQVVKRRTKKKTPTKSKKKPVVKRRIKKKTSTKRRTTRKYLKKKKGGENPPYTERIQQGDEVAKLINGILVGSLGLYKIANDYGINLEEYKGIREPKDIDIVIMGSGGDGVPSITIENLYNNGWKLYNKDGSEVPIDNAKNDLLQKFSSSYGSFKKNGIELDLVKHPSTQNKFNSLKNNNNKYENMILKDYENKNQRL